MAVDRRSFLQMSTLAGVSFFIPEFLSATCAGADFFPKRLVVLQLTGGNDGLNTVIPFRDDVYYQSRPGIALASNKVLSISDELGFHPSLGNLYRLYQQGAVSVIQNVGYPQPHRSHQKCLDVWHSGYTEACSTGWLGRCSDHYTAISLFNAEAECCLALKGEKSGYPPSYTNFNLPLSHKLRVISSKIQSEPHHNVFYLTHQGYDMHVAQTETQAQLLRELDEAIDSFVHDLKRNDKFKDVLILTFSEFGRRVAENEFGGTDHGTANCMFAISGSLKNAGLHGSKPVLSDLDDGDLKHSIDFRQVYATVLERWLSADAASILNHPFTPLDFV